MRRHRGGFTLIELLVVIAIIAILAAILFPVFAQARGKARQTACLSNMKQIGMAIQMYHDDYQELPPHLSTLASTYVTDKRLLVCPSDPLAGHQNGNDFLTSDPNAVLKIV